MSKKIIDVSEHQGTINWEAVKGQIDGAIIRCGYGDDLASQDDIYLSLIHICNKDLRALLRRQ